MSTCYSTCESAPIIKIASFSFLNEIFRTFEGTLGAWSPKQGIGFMFSIRNTTFRLAKFEIDLLSVMRQNKQYLSVKFFAAPFDLPCEVRQLGGFSMFSDTVCIRHDRIPDEKHNRSDRKLSRIGEEPYYFAATTISQLQNLLVRNSRFRSEL